MNDKIYWNYLTGKEIKINRAKWIVSPRKLTIFWVSSMDIKLNVRIKVKIWIYHRARYLSWLERRANNAKVTGWIPLRAR